MALINTLGQESYINGRWNLKAGYSRYETGTFQNGKMLKTGNYRIEGNYGVTNYIELGTYLGFQKIEIPSINWTDSSVIDNSFVNPLYGINANLHLFPFIIHQKDFRFDLYVTGKFGGVYYNTPDNYYLHGNMVEYGIGGGASFYIWDHLGLYAEYCYGKYYFRDNKNFRYGLTFKF